MCIFNGTNSVHSHTVNCADVTIPLPSLPPPLPSRLLLSPLPSPPPSPLVPLPPSPSPLPLLYPSPSIPSPLPPSPSPLPLPPLLSLSLPLRVSSAKLAGAGRCGVFTAWENGLLVGRTRTLPTPGWQELPPAPCADLYSVC